jgi:hypothetical protein
MKLSLQYPPTPEFAPQHAELAVQAARAVSRVRLDYSVRSLERLDGIIEGFRRERITADQAPETLFTLGCYLGEVIIRECGGEWRIVSETSLGPVSDSRLVVQLDSGGVANPIGKVFKRLHNGRVDSLPFFYRVLAAQAAGEPEPEPPSRKWWQVWKR